VTRQLGPAIYGAVVIDLRLKDDHRVLRAIQSAVTAPAGCDVRFIVAPGQYRPAFAASWLMENGRRLGSITFECSDPQTVASWVAEFRGEYIDSRWAS
jgi:hypothetical protein